MRKLETTLSQYAILRIFYNLHLSLDSWEQCGSGPCGLVAPLAKRGYQETDEGTIVWLPGIATWDIKARPMPWLSTPEQRSCRYLMVARAWDFAAWLSHSHAHPREMLRNASAVNA